jgi:hypothetical protein
VKVASFVAVQYVFTRIVHNNERILGISVLWQAYRHTISDGATSDVSAVGEDG